MAYELHVSLTLIDPEGNEVVSMARDYAIADPKEISKAVGHSGMSMGCSPRVSRFGLTKTTESIG